MEEELINDYEINMLLDSRDHFRSRRRTELAYFYTRSVIRYMTRLVFAIGWDKIRARATWEVSKKIYSELFIYGNDQIEPGKFASLLISGARRLGMEAAVQKETAVLCRLRDVRNNNAHFINTVDFSAFYDDADEAFRLFGEMFSGKICSYIVPVENDGNGRIICEQFRKGASYSEEISLAGDSFCWSKKGNRLFYSVMDTNSGLVRYYCLSPFLGVPDFLEGKEPHFLVYGCTEDHGYGSEFDLLHYDGVIPGNIREAGGELTADFEEKRAEYRRTELFGENAMIFPESSGWVRSASSDVFINISSYPGFGEVLRSSYKYCFEICPVRENVVEFCRDWNMQMIQITGNGGVGKTALVLSILSELLMRRDRYGYSNLIFLSAKKSFYASDFADYHPQDHEKEADIHSYGELIRKLAGLLEIGVLEDDLSGTEDKIVRQINENSEDTGKRKRFLLVIDDMDSLDRNDQDRIKKFVYRFDARVFKTILTTRDIVESSPVSCRLEELSADQSLAYGKWYLETVLGIPSWDGWGRKKAASDWISQYGEGNPLTIQMLLALTREGREANYCLPATQNERMAYLYNTVQNLLSDEEKEVFDLCRRLYLALPKEERTQEMLLTVPYYLSAGKEIGKETFDRAVKKFYRLHLLQPSGNGLQFRPYSSLILSDEIIHMGAGGEDGMYCLIWKAVKEDPGRWLAIGDVERALIDVIISSEGDRLFDTWTARTILERIQEEGSINGELRRRISAWLSKHSVVENESAVRTRLIEEIERTWKDYKQILDKGTDNIETETKLNDDIRKLRELLGNEADKEISGRLKAVREEIREYY